MGVALDEYLTRSHGASAELESQIAEGAQWLHDEIASARETLGTTWQEKKTQLEQVYEELSDVASGWGPIPQAVAWIAIEGTRFDVRLAEKVGDTLASAGETLADGVQAAYGPKHLTLGDLAMSKAHDAVLTATQLKAAAPWVAFAAKEVGHTAWQQARIGQLPGAVKGMHPGDVAAELAFMCALGAVVGKLPAVNLNMGTAKALKATRFDVAGKMFAAQEQKVVHLLSGESRLHNPLEAARARLELLLHQQTGAGAREFARLSGKIDDEKKAIAILVRRDIFPSAPANRVMQWFDMSMTRAKNRLERTSIGGRDWEDALNFKVRLTKIRDDFLPYIKAVPEMDIAADESFMKELKAYVNKFEELAAEYNIPLKR